MVFAETGVHNVAVEVAIITTAGLIVVAIIGVFTAKITSGARNDAKNNAEDAFKSAGIAKDYAAALMAKDALIDSLEARLAFVEQHDRRCSERLEDVEKEMERREIEHEEQRRASALIERDQNREISQLRTELDELQAKG